MRNPLRTSNRGGGQFDRLVVLRSEEDRGRFTLAGSYSCRATVTLAHAVSAYVLFMCASVGWSRPPRRPQPVAHPTAAIYYPVSKGTTPHLTRGAGRV